MRFINNSMKEYPTMIKICIYREPLRLSESSGRCKSTKKASNPPSERSLARSRASLMDLCMCNDFDLFCTFTFDPKRYNSKSILSCKSYMNTWIRNAKERHSKNLKYLIIPELHKSGAIHFHALFKNYEGRLRESGIFQNGRQVFNIPYWHFGFSTCCKIDNIEHVSRYISKYITKEMITFPGDKRYYCSQGLRRPVRSHNVSLDFLSSLPPLMKYRIFSKCEFSADSDCEYITISKDDLRNLTDFSANSSSLLSKKSKKTIDYFKSLML